MKGAYFNFNKKKVLKLMFVKLHAVDFPPVKKPSSKHSRILGALL